jgi:hypothetical protein
MRFKCPCCDKWQDEIPDVHCPMPDYAHDVPESERKKRIYLTSDLCVVDKEYFFIRGLLLLPIKNSADRFGWGIWSSLSRENFQRYYDSYDDDMSGWEPMFGYLANQLAGYPDSLNLKLSVQPGSEGERPTVTLEPTDHSLAIAQREGVTLEKVLEIVAPFLSH